MTSTGTCRLFGTEEKLVKAHIAPKWVFNELREKNKGGKAPVIISSKGIPPKKSQIGIYDENILSIAAERHTEQWDNYAKDFFSKNYELRQISDRTRTAEFHVIKDFDYEKLKLFCISILWKASISQREEYKLISLGQKYEDLAKNMILKKDPGDTSTFAILLMKFSPHKSIEGLEKSFLSPFRSKIDEITFNKFRILDWQISIKTDTRAVPKSLSKFVLKPNHPLIVINMPFEESKDLGAIANIINAQP